MMKYILFLSFITLGMSNCKTSKSQSDTSLMKELNSSNETKDEKPYVINRFDVKVDKINKTASEWKSELTPEEYYVLREEGTERSFTSPLNKNKEEGLYSCAGCGTVLFTSKTKFDSGTGWPSFYKPDDPAYIHEDTDYKLGYARTEVECAICGGHLGHVFEDGPKPTGLRYCINGVALDFIKAEN